MQRINLTENERIARSISGIENGEHFAMNNENSLDNMLKQEATNKFNQQVDDYNNKLEAHQQLLKDYASKLSDNIAGIECKPLFDKIHVTPFATNPFQKITKEGNIIVDMGGATPTFKSNDSGQIEEEEAYIICGTVVDVGPDVKYVQPGDAVFYIKPNEIDVPLYNTGLKCITERSVIAVINSGLTERFNECK